MRIFLVGKHEPEEGHKYRVERTLEFLDADVATGGGAPSQGTISLIDRQAWSFEELGGGKRKINIDKMNVEMSVESGADPTVEVLTSPLHGKTISATKGEDGKWTFTLEGGEPNAGEKDALAKFATAENLENDRFPAEELNLDQEWKAGWESLRSIIGPQFEPTSGEAAFKLARLTRFDGHRCAEIEADIQMTGEFADEDPPLMSRINLKGTILRSLNSYADLKTTLEGTLTLQGQHASGAPVEVTAPVKLTHVQLRIADDE